MNYLDDFAVAFYLIFRPLFAWATGAMTASGLLAGAIWIIMVSIKKQE